jgi:hypothetical protein
MTSGGKYTRSTSAGPGISEDDDDVNDDDAPAVPATAAAWMTALVKRRSAV